jgi:hypothetical protein
MLRRAGRIRVVSGKKLLLIAFLIITGIFAAIAAIGCFSLSHQSEGSFGIFLSENNSLVISDEDIVWYNKTSHEIKLTQAGATKIEELHVPVFGSQFTVKIDGQEIYNGTFMTPISSLPPPPSDVIIETLVQNYTIRIQIGYPSSQPTGTDPRINSKVFSHFQNINKIVQ